MNIGFLNAYPDKSNASHFPQPYGELFKAFFHDKVSSEYNLTEYKITEARWPGALHDCDGYIIGGSTASVYDRASWIMKLMEFICGCHAHQTPLVGICFGHQVIAQALGGGVHQALNGWGLGNRQFKINQAKPWMDPPLEHCSLLFTHQDQVKMPPHGATLLGSDSFCLHQMYAIGEHIFALQGHPEFNEPFFRAVMKELKGSVGDKLYQTALDSLDQPDDSELIGRWIGQFFAQAKAASQT